jgi:GxxExxY protein
LEHEELTYKIIGCAHNVYNELGFGFLESVYHNAMIVELNHKNFMFETEKPLSVHYRDQIVGKFSIDLFVENSIIVELKSVEHLKPQHEAQLVNYLNGLEQDVGLLINFGSKGVEVRRKFRTPRAVD